MKLLAIQDSLTGRFYINETFCVGALGEAQLFRPDQLTAALEYRRGNFRFFLGALSRGAALMPSHKWVSERASLPDFGLVPMSYEFRALMPEPDCMDGDGI